MKIRILLGVYRWKHIREESKVFLIHLSSVTLFLTLPFEVYLKRTSVIITIATTQTKMANILNQLTCILQKLITQRRNH